MSAAARLQWLRLTPELHPDLSPPDLGVWAAGVDPDTLTRLVMHAMQDEVTADEDTTSEVDYEDDADADSPVRWTSSQRWPVVLKEVAGLEIVDWPAVVVLEIRPRDGIGTLILGALLGECRPPEEGGPVIVVFGDGWAQLHHAIDAVQLPYSLDAVHVANDLAQAVSIGVAMFDRAQRAPAQPRPL